MPVAMRSEWGAKVAIAATCKRDITAAKGVISGARPWDTAIWSGCTAAGAPWAREWAQFSAHSAQDWARASQVLGPVGQELGPELGPTGPDFCNFGPRTWPRWAH